MTTTHSYNEQWQGIVRELLTQVLTVQRQQLCNRDNISYPSFINEKKRLPNLGWAEWMLTIKQNILRTA